MHASDPVDSIVTKIFGQWIFESYKILNYALNIFALKRLELNVFVPLLNNKSKSEGNYLLSHTD